jgi:hypothetical protein
MNKIIENMSVKKIKKESEVVILSDEDCKKILQM